MDKKLSELGQILNLSPETLLYLVQSSTSLKGNLGMLDNRYLKVFNVVAYGAVGDDATDDTSAVQDAIDDAHAAGGGVVYFPSNTYKITLALTTYSNVIFRGDGMEISLIHQTTLNQNGVNGSGLSSVGMDDIGLIGNGTGSTPGTGTGIGLNLDYGTNGNNPFHSFRNFMVRNFASDGLRIQTPIVCSFDKVYSAFNGGHGFNWYEGGTSCNFKDCWARQNKKAGYHGFECVYQSLTGCASDNNGINYDYVDAQSLGFFACGSEGALIIDGVYNGYGFKFDNCSVITTSACWITDNRNIGVWVTNGSQVVKIDVADNTPNGSAVSFIKVDAGCDAMILGLHNSTANDLAEGTTLIIDDGTGAISASGHLVLKAGTNHLVKTTVLRQDDTSNSYKNGTTIVLTGWGQFTPGAASNKSEDVTFALSFDQRPIVLITYGGDNSGGASTYGSGGNSDKGGVFIKAHTILPSKFTAQVHSGDGTNWGGTTTVFYQWLAIGEFAGAGVS